MYHVVMPPRVRVMRLARAPREFPVATLHPCALTSAVNTQEYPVLASPSASLLGDTTGDAQLANPERWDSAALHSSTHPPTGGCALGKVHVNPEGTAAVEKYICSALTLAPASALRDTSTHFVTAPPATLTVPTVSP
jgi:hypothetical protein